MKTQLLLAAALVGMSQVTGQSTCPKNSHLVSSLPGWSVSPQLFPCMYAGTIESSRQPGVSHNLFYWLFKNTTLNSSNAPLIIWIQGETGMSATQGIFVQHGPIQVSQSTKGNNTYYSVSPSDDGTNFGEVADVLYLDQPVGTGFSYGSDDNDLLTSVDDISREFVNFVDSFLTMYPEYKKPRKIILMGESAAGKYLPPFTKALDDYISQGGQLDIQAVIIGNPFQASIFQRLYSHNTAMTLNIVDDNNFDQIALLRDRCIETYSQKDSLANETYDACTKILSYVTEVGGGISSFDGRKSINEWNAMLEPFQSYLGNASYKDDIYKALHVNESTKSQIFQASNKAVLEALIDDANLDYTQWYDWLIAHGYATLLYTGEWDQRDAITSQEEWLRNSKYLDPLFWEKSRKIYYVNNSYTSGKSIVGGYWRSDPKNLMTLFTMPKAGHSALRTDVPTLIQIVQDYLTKDKKLSCHSSDSQNCQTSQTMCAAMNTCNKNGYCQDGQCICNKGFAGADCGEKAYFLTNFFNKKFVLNGTQTVLFEYREGIYPGEAFEVTISSQQPMDIYFNPVTAFGKVQVEPNEFNNLAAFKNQNMISISSDQFPQLSTFAMGVRINGVQHYNNKYLVSAFTVQFTIYDTKSGQKQVLKRDVLQSSNEEVIELIAKTPSQMKPRTRPVILDQ